jgi:hypothetical protein
MSIAWTGRVTMARADWGDENGSTVTLKLPMNKDAQDRRNPFHAYTKRRKGKAGTRFMMAVQTAGEDVRHALYEDEAMLAGWNDSQQNGHTVKLWLCNDGMGHPFDGISRTAELIVSLVELDDDQEPIDQKMRDRVEKQGIHPQSRLSVACAALCRNPKFHEYLYQDEWCKQKRSGRHGATWEDIAKNWFYRHCEIKSRRELDDPANTKAIEMFHYVRKKFAESQEAPF